MGLTVNKYYQRIKATLVTTFILGLMWAILTWVMAPATLLQGHERDLARYAANEIVATNTWNVSITQRATALFDTMPYAFLVWMPIGMVSVFIALHHGGGRWRFPAMAGLACIAASSIQAFGVTDAKWLKYGLACLAFSGLMGFISYKRQNVAGESDPYRIGWTTVALIWSLWMLLAGIGVVWLADLAVRGPVSLRYVGIRQLDTLWLSAYVILPFSAWGSRSFLSAVTEVSALWDRPRGPFLLTLMFITVLALLTWVGSSSRFGAGTGYPHVSAEFVRLLCAVAVAWLMARHVEWSNSTGHGAKAGLLVMAVLGGCLSVLVLTRDLGPFLALGVALVPVVLVALQRPASFGVLGLRVLLAVAVWITMAIAIRYLLTEWIPSQSWAPERLVLREEALRDAFSARLDYASQIAWLLEAAGPNGFGLGSVPWCGAKAYVGLGECTKSSGVPVQFGSDYVHTAITAIWGYKGAVAALAMSLALIAFVVWAVSRQNSMSGIALTASRLHAWIVVVFGAMLMGQLLVSVSGNLGLIPLSGVTQPFFGLGTVALLSTAAWVGFALAGLKRIEVKDLWLSASLNRYFLSTLAGAALFILTAVLWQHYSLQPMKDRLTPQVVVDGLRLLNSLSQRSGTPHAFRLSDSDDANEIACAVGAFQVNQLAERVSRHTGKDFGTAELSCREAMAVRAALNWMLGRSSLESIHALEHPEGHRIGVINPYRLNGCIGLPGETPAHTRDERLAHPCPKPTESQRKLIASSPQLHQALSGLTSSVRLDATQKSDMSRFGHLTRSVEDLPAPKWAIVLGLDRWMRAIISIQEVKPTVLGKGDDVTLSISAGAQALAQELVDCFVGPCTALSGEQTRSQSMLESARARMASVLVVDVGSSKIEAAASAHTDCYEAHHQGKQLQSCVPLSQGAKHRPWKLVNQALHGEAMCGSLCKIQEALALLRNQSPLTQTSTLFTTTIRKSETERFIDEFMCADKAFEPGCIQRRLEILEQTTRDLGGQNACRSGDQECSAMNLLAGRSGVFATSRMKLLTNPKHPELSLIDTYKPGASKFTQNAAKECHANGHEKRWRGCKGEGLVAHIAELFGQGNAVATPTGVAQALVTLANSSHASPLGSFTQLSILESGAPLGSTQRNAVEQQHAKRLLRELLEPIKPEGTAHSSCLKAIHSDGLINCRNNGRWVVASKTGTPLFPHDGLTFRQRKAHCDKVSALSDGPVKQHEWARCVVPATKWYALLLGKNQGEQIVWTKAVVVLTERNWSAETGLIDSPFDRGGNVAAEIGLRLARKLAENAELSQ